MFDELEATFTAVPPNAKPEGYAAAIIDGNCLGKQTTANRRHSLQHLRELYGLDPALPVFRVLSRLWAMDSAARRLLALLASLSRDPLLLSTAPTIIGMPDGAELQRSVMRGALERTVGQRLSDSTIDKVIRNAASSWAQSGHLEGRTFKIRRLVKATPAAVAFALYLAHSAGFLGHEMLTSAWVKVLDCTPSQALDLAIEAKRLGLLDLRVAGEVFDLNLDRLDPRAVGAVR